MPHDETRRGWRTWLRALAAHLRAHGAAALAGDTMPRPTPAEVYAATMGTWAVAQIRPGAWHWRAQCGCVVETGEQVSMENAQHAAQATCTRLRRYAVQ